MKTIDINAALAATKQIKVTTDALQQRKSSLVDQINDLKVANQILYRKPLLRDEIKKMMMDRIDRLAAEFPREAKWDTIFSDFVFPKGQRPASQGDLSLSTMTFTQSSKPISLQDRDAMGTPGDFFRVMGSSASANFFGSGEKSEALDEKRAYFFFGDLIKGKVELHFDRYFRRLESEGRLKTDGMTIEQKQAEINVNDSKIAELDQELDAINTQLDTLTSASEMASKTGGVK